MGDTTIETVVRCSPAGRPGQILTDARVSITGKVESSIAGTPEGPRGVDTDLVTVVPVLSAFINV
jgi:hypothetical protein